MRYSILQASSLVLLGPTASGKTSLAVEIARAKGYEIVSVDSRQVYRGLDIGTGKDLAEYGEGASQVPVHMLDVADPHEEFHLFRFVQEAAHVASSQKNPLLFCGGTGLYLDALLRDYDLSEAPPNANLRRELADLDHEGLCARLLALNPQLHNNTDLEDRERLLRAIEIAEKGMEAPEENTHLPPCPVLGLRWPLRQLHERISIRLDQRLEEGMLDEVQGLLDQGVPPEKLLRLGLEYRLCTRHLQGDFERSVFAHELRKAIVRFAKQQRSWFRRMEKKGVLIHWIDMEKGNALEQALSILGTSGAPS
jgi:tRNA dimethylallyltransferase